MSQSAATPPAGPPQADRWLPGPKPPDEGWTQKKFILVLGFVLACHVLLIFVFGTRKPFVPRPVTNAPRLRLASNTDELIALGDPSLFARPNQHDVVSAFWRRTPAVPPPNFNWTEPPRCLPPAPENFGAAFHQFVQASGAKSFSQTFRPEPQSLAPPAPPDDTLPTRTTVQVTGGLAARALLTPLNPLPPLAANDVIPPTRVQVLVDPSGNVASAVVLPNPDVIHTSEADQRALQQVQRLRFAPAPALMFGQITFTWHTVPLAATNEPAH
jgi:hypothetical protein